MASDVSPAKLTVEAMAEGEVSALAKAVLRLEGEALERHRSLLGRLIPGGDLAGSLDAETQAKAVSQWARAGSSPKAVGYRLWKIHQLTPSETIKTAAREALEALPEEARPGACSRRAREMRSIPPSWLAARKST